MRGRLVTQLFLSETVARVLDPAIGVLDYSSYETNKFDRLLHGVILLDVGHPGPFAGPINIKRNTP